MLCRLWVASALCAVVLSAPTIPTAAGPAERAMEDYFNLAATKVVAAKSFPPTCDLSKAVLPTTSVAPLPPPSAGLSLKHVAIGRGTQNYSCSTGVATAAPVAVGAIATLFNSSCIASAYPDLLASLPNLALQFDLSSTGQSTFSPANLDVSGHHYFSNSTTPAFTTNFGFAPCSKNNTSSAPAGAVVGQGGVGVGAVPWLKLVTRIGATEGLSEVYRVNTAGGMAPMTCAGMPAAFEVQYAAEYWFFGSL